jgi:splicing factor 45
MPPLQRNQKNNKKGSESLDYGEEKGTLHCLNVCFFKSSCFTFADVFDFLDPAFPNEYEVVKEQKRIRREEKRHQEQHRRHHQRHHEYESDRENHKEEEEEEQEEQEEDDDDIDGQPLWKPPGASGYEPQSQPLPPPPAAVHVMEDVSGEDAYMRRMRLSQMDEYSESTSRPQLGIGAEVKSDDAEDGPTSVILFENMVGPGEADDDLEEETASECAKYGQVEKCVIYEVG